MENHCMASTSTHEYIQADGIKTFFVKAGSGHPLLLIHGAAPGASSLVNWKLNIEPLAAAGFAVYAYDQPGFGYTENPSDHSIECRVTHAKALINALGLDQFHVVGNSVGGYIAARLALEDPRVRSFVTTTSGSLSPQGSPDSQALAKKHSEELREYEPSLENMRKLTLGTIFNKVLVTEELVRERYEMSTGKNYEAQLQRRNAQRQRPVYDDLRQLRVKALLLWGNNDRGVSVERGLELFRRVPGAEFHLFDKCAHWVQWDQAERFNRLVTDFLREAAQRR
jgi:pimeloyl-ACP methyl ester carboxylesterase